MEMRTVAIAVFINLYCLMTAVTTAILRQKDDFMYEGSFGVFLGLIWPLVLPIIALSALADMLRKVWKAWEERNGW